MTIPVANGDLESDHCAIDATNVGNLLHPASGRLSFDVLHIMTQPLTRILYSSSISIPRSAPYLLSPLFLRSAIITTSYEDNTNRQQKCVEFRHIDKACKVIDV